MDDALAAPDGRRPGLEDIWLQLHLAFEAIWDYRFLYRDLVEILSRNRRLRVRFARILKRADDSAHQVMRGLSQAGVMRASAAELDAAATNVLVLATFWLNYAAVRGDKDENRSEEHPSELQSLMRISYAVFCLKKKKTHKNTHQQQQKI